MWGKSNYPISPIIKGLSGIIPLEIDTDWLVGDYHLYL